MDVLKLIELLLLFLIGRYFISAYLSYRSANDNITVINVMTYFTVGLGGAFAGVLVAVMLISMNIGIHWSGHPIANIIVNVVTPVVAGTASAVYLASKSSATRR